MSRLGLRTSLGLRPSFGLGVATPTTGGGGSYITAKGNPIFDWAAVTPTLAGTAAKQTANTFDGQGAALRLTNTTTPVADVTGLNFDLTDFKSFVVPIYREPGLGKTVVSVFATKGGFTNFWQFNFVVDDIGWAEYAVLPDGLSSAGSPTLDGGYTQLRFRLQNDPNTYTYPAGPGSVDIGNPRMGMRTRPKLMFHTDDGTASHVSSPANGKTIKGIFDAYGVKGTAYVVPRVFGATGHEPVQTFRDLKAAGWSVVSHSWAHPGSTKGEGLRLLGPVGYAPRVVASVDVAANTITCAAAHSIVENGAITYYYAVEFAGSDLPAPLVAGTIYYARQTSTTAFTLHPTWQDSIANTNVIDLTSAGVAANFTWRFGGSANDHTAIQADLQRCMNELISAGFSAEEVKHFATPQGGVDVFVLTACENLGLSTVRGTMATVRNPGANSAGSYPQTGRPAVLGRRHNLPGIIAADSASVTEAQLLAYVDKVISLGGTGCVLVHGLTTATIAKLEAVLAYAKQKSDDGLLDIVTVDQWWRGFAGDRTKLPLI